MRYFIGMETTRLKKGISFSQRKYVLDLLIETGILGCKISDTHMDTRRKTENIEEFVENYIFSETSWKTNLRIAH